MLRTDSVFRMFLVFLFGNLDEYLAYFVLIYLVNLLLNFYFQKQQHYLESTTQSPQWIKTASPLCILILCNVLDHLVPGYCNGAIRNLYSSFYIVYFIIKISPYLSDETFFFRKVITVIINKLKNRVHDILNEAG